MRTLIKHVAWHLRVSWDHIEEIETVLAETLEAKQYEISEYVVKLNRLIACWHIVFSGDFNSFT